MFNILLGHAGGSACLHSFPYKDGEQLVEGTWVVFDKTTGTLVKQTGAYDELAQGALYIVYGGNTTRLDSKLMKHVTVAMGTSFYGETDQVAAVAIPIGSALTVKDGVLAPAADKDFVVGYAGTANTSGKIEFSRK